MDTDNRSTLVLPQGTHRAITTIPGVKEADLRQEPFFIRRATVPFAWENGGPVTRRFLTVAENAGYIHPNSVVIMKKSLFRWGSGASPFWWHFDMFQSSGAGPDPQNFIDAAHSHSGLIMTVFDTTEHPADLATLFLEGGTVELDLSARDVDQEYQLGRNRPSGPLYWYHHQVQKQVGAGRVQIVPLRIGTVYTYSNEIHRVPVEKSGWGSRMVIRINTPRDPKTNPLIQNLVGRSHRPPPVFRMTSPDQWRLEPMAPPLAR